MNGVLKITLKSDLCSGSGYSYAGIIDSDTSYDEYGLPYISGRSLKGCLREAAQMIGVGEDIFGSRGRSSDISDETKLAIYDARIKDYEKIADEIKKYGVTQESVLEAYTSVKAQTALLGSGVAKEGSLRFTRVVNRHNPLNMPEELMFEAPVVLYDEEKKDDLKKAAKALRHIGMDRNRGLGNVKCELVETDPYTNRANVIDCTGIADLADDGSAKLRYVIRTLSPVMISESDDTISETYINGRTVLGFFATSFIREGNKPEDEAFERLFLRGGLKFSPLYPCDAASDKIYYPAPLYINKLKKMGKLVNMTAFASDIVNKKITENGNQPKKLRGKYLSDDYTVKEVYTEIIYHNRHESAESKKQLYFSQAILADQVFAGEITGKKSDVMAMVEIMKKYEFSLGKSRKAKYGRCELIKCTASKLEDAKRDFVKGQKILVTLKTDGLFIDENTGAYTVKTDVIRDQISKQLGLDGKTDGSMGVYSEIETKEISGYYGVWNLRRQSVPAVAAGSAFEYLVTEDVTISEKYVGVKNNEGCGEVCLTACNKQFIISCNDLEKPADDSPEADSQDAVYILPLIRRNAIDKAKADIQKVTNQISAGGLNASTVGRLTLMLSESVNANKDDVLKVKSDLDSKVDSIKDDDKKKKIKDIVKYYYDNILSKANVDDDGILDQKDKESLRIYGLSQALIAMKYKLK